MFVVPLHELKEEFAVGSNETITNCTAVKDKNEDLEKVEKMNDLKGDVPS